MTIRTPTGSLPVDSAPIAPKSLNLRSVGLLLLSVALGAIGQLVLKLAVNQLGKLELSLSMFTKMAGSPVLILAIGLYGLSAVLWLLALMKADLSFAFPFLSLTYIAVLIGGAFLFHDQITPLRLVGFVVIMGGLLVIALDERLKLVKVSRSPPVPPIVLPIAQTTVESTALLSENSKN